MSLVHLPGSCHGSTDATRFFDIEKRFMNKLTRQARQWPMVLVLGVQITLALLASATHAAEPLPLSGYSRPVIEKFLTDQTAGVRGKVQIRIDTPLSGKLLPCAALEVFLPSAAPLRGRVLVGVRCMAEPRWTRYVQARIAVVGIYQAAALPIEAGHILTRADAVVMEADMSTLPGSVVTDESLLIGQMALTRIVAGTPIRREQLRGVFMVQQGQTVKVVTRGAGFMVSSEGKAMNAGAAGALVQVRMQGGQLLSGTINADGIVERGSSGHQTP